MITVDLELPRLRRYYCDEAPRRYMEAARLAHLLISTSSLPDDDRRQLHQDTALQFAQDRAQQLEGVWVELGVFPRAVATEEVPLGEPQNASCAFYFLGEEYPIPGVMFSDLVIGYGPSDLAVPLQVNFDATRDQLRLAEGKGCYDADTRLYTCRPRVGDDKGVYQLKIGKDGRVEEAMIPEPAGAVSE